MRHFKIQVFIVRTWVWIQRLSTGSSSRVNSSSAHSPPPPSVFQKHCDLAWKGLSFHIKTSIEHAQAFGAMALNLLQRKINNQYRHLYYIRTFSHQPWVLKSVETYLNGCVLQFQAHSGLRLNSDAQPVLFQIINKIFLKVVVLLTGNWLGGVLGENCTAMLSYHIFQ